MVFPRNKNHDLTGQVQQKYTKLNHGVIRWFKERNIRATDMKGYGFNSPH